MLKLNSLPAPIPAWGQNLRPGDTVLFAFPCAEPDQVPKRRACLVLEVETRGGRRVVELAYGTSVDTSANVGQEVRVATPEEMAAAGVHRATRFVCARRTVVPLDHSGWDTTDSHPSPVIGRLPPRAMARMHAIRARIHASRDIAADRRAARQRSFTVEHRRSRSSSIRSRKAVRG